MAKKAIIPVPVEREKTLFEDFTILRWVKWTTRQPDWNGSVYIRWNSKWTSNGIVHNGYLIKLDGENTNSSYKVLKSGKFKVKYTANQKRLLEDMYWLEEKHDIEGYVAYTDTLISEEFKAKINVPEQFKES
jgi:hypothetical protein